MSNLQTTASSSSARSDVEAILLEHPDVTDALLINEEGPDGHSYPLAYVVPHAERMKEAKTRLSHGSGQEGRPVEKGFRSSLPFRARQLCPNVCGLDQLLYEQAASRN